MSDLLRNKRLGVLTSGGDAQGMNAAVRAVVRTALEMGLQPYAIYEGYRGMVGGGQMIRKMDWDSVGGILQQGGTIIGTARCNEFFTREGRLQAAHNLILNGIDNLILIGGDGTLTGANIFREEWPGLLKELVETGKTSQDIIERHPDLTIIGMVGSIDNDMCGTDMTIGADTALHRIVQAVDAISSTAASHQRSFVVEVMGRRCGYLALMAALSTGADWVLIPESPPNLDLWEEKMCQVMRAGREAGRRDSIVIVAEGARDRYGKPITSEYVKQILEEKMGEDTRVTILGHVQRGGSPSAFDRNLSTMLGHESVMAIASGNVRGEAWLIGIRGNRITRSPLMSCVNETRSVSDAMKSQKFDLAMQLRGGSFADSFRIVRTLVRALPHPPRPGQRRLRLAVMHAGGPAPGMNTAVRSAVRIGVDKGHILLGIRNGFEGFIAGDIREMDWMSVNGWAHRGGAELGTNRKIPANGEFYAIARNIEKFGIEGLLIIGGWAAYQVAHLVYSQRHLFPAFNIPIICLPATIDNDLPGSELSIGADTALNNIVEAVDKIKQSAVASRRCFVVEVMGDECGYLALMSGLATGAERVYLPEEGVTLNDLKKDLDNLISGFRHGKRLGLMIRNESVNQFYTTDFMAALFEEEGRNLFDVRTAILGHLQQGGDPTPFDRIQAARMAARCIDYLIEEAENSIPGGHFIGMQAGKIVFTPLDDLPRMFVKIANDQKPNGGWNCTRLPVYSHVPDLRRRCMMDEEEFDLSSSRWSIYMKFIARFLALIVAIVFILFLPLSLLGFNMGRVAFNRPLLKTVLTDAVTESQLIPSALAWFSEEVSAGLPLAEAAEDDLTAVLISLTQEGWQAIRLEVLSDDILAGWVSSTVDSFYDWIDSDDPAPRFQLDMKSFKERVNSDFGFRALEIAYNALPPCGDPQITEFLFMLETAAPGSNIYYPPCQFPELYRDDQLTDYLNSLVEVVNVIPDTFELPLADAATPQSLEGLQTLKTGLRFLRTTYWMGLVISFLLLVLIGVLAIRSIRGIARWGGIPLALAGLGAVILSWIPGVFLIGYLASGPLQDSSPLLREEILQVVSRLFQETFSSMMIQGLIILVVGGLILVFVGGIMGKQQMTRKPREEASSTKPQ